LDLKTVPPEFHRAVPLKCADCTPKDPILKSVSTPQNEVKLIRGLEDMMSREAF